MKKDIAKMLLDIKAVFLRPEEPFTWASGIKSPIYCDNRLTLGFPDVRSAIEKGLSELIQDNFPECEVLMGTSTAGIPHAAIVAHLLDLPMGYVRSSTKSHGRNNKIEGRLVKGQKVVVVEDLISTGGSAIDTALALRDFGAEVLGIVSIFTYNMQKGLNNLSSSNLVNHSLCDFDTLIEVAADSGYIERSAISGLLKFRENFGK